MKSDSAAIRVVIVDDEPLARRKLAHLLKGDPEVEVIASCGSAREALEAIRLRAPDLIFLDVQMPGTDGFEFLKSLDVSPLPQVIFVTAYDQYAVRAFRVHALDYLLKPVDADDFAEALRRARGRIRSDHQDQLQERLLAAIQSLRLERERPATVRPIDRIVVKAGGKAFLLRTDEIDWISAEGKYVRLHVGQNSYLLRESISELEARLDPSSFLRIHRSTIVNPDRIQELHQMFHGEYEVILRGGVRLTLSRRYRARVRDIIGGSL
ncbi:MAG TPA: LytTR family DNA-binding domain-containing protein [Blastocatellia bacterium]|nr:LytTR family DNA-binding domain-containing protein [Blastocatellia bacterium]